MTSTLLPLLAGLAVGWGLHALWEWVLDGAAPLAAWWPDVRVGDVREFERNGYLYYAIVRRLFTRRGKSLVEYQVWREDVPEPEDDGRGLWRKGRLDFVSVYTKRVRRGGETPSSPARDDVRVGDVREFEGEGYLYRAIVRRLFTRRGVSLVEYQSWRDDKPEPEDDGLWLSVESRDRFTSVFHRMARRGGEPPSSPSPPSSPARGDASAEDVDACGVRVGDVYTSDASDGYRDSWSTLAAVRWLFMREGLVFVRYQSWRSDRREPEDGGRRLCWERSLGNFLDAYPKRVRRGGEPAEASSAASGAPSQQE